MQLSVWERESFFDCQDIIIVGSGLVGLWSALELKQKQPKLKITILERGLIPTGASTRNAGFACFGSPSELMHDKQLLGEDKMWDIVEMRYRGMQKMSQVLKNESIDLDICGGYEVYATDFTDWQGLNDGVEWLNKSLEKITGTEQCFTWADDQLKEFGFSGFGSMIENKLEGYLHSGKLVQSLLRSVQSLGVQVLTGIEVKQWQTINGKIRMDTATGIDFTAEQVLICTNALTSKLVPELNIVPARGQIVLTSPVEGLKMKGAFHYDEGFYYFRNLGDRILLGGARNKAFEAERTNEMITSEAIQQHLENFIAEHLLPRQEFTIEQRWSGIMGFTDNKEPVVKQISDNVAVAIACNGMGVALSPIIAEKVCEMML
jgi:glycine/D-amino acid oxidase-like deaminating enzyme